MLPILNMSNYTFMTFINIVPIDMAIKLIVLTFTRLLKTHANMLKMVKIIILNDDAIALTMRLLTARVIVKV